MRLYIATPINARKEKSVKARFINARVRCETLRDLLSEEHIFRGFTEIVTPFDVNPIGSTTSETLALSRCVAAVLESDAIYLDHGWESSKGCNLEYRTAKI